jgi:hypothetical protein
MAALEQVCSIHEGQGWSCPLRQGPGVNLNRLTSIKPVMNGEER